MNLDRLLREVERRLVGLTEEHRDDVLDAVREEFARERRRRDPENTVEAERERRMEAETIREVLESINRHAALDPTAEEVVKQLSRVVEFDSCSLSLVEPDGAFRIRAVRGFPEPSRVVGQSFRNELTDEILRRHWPASVVDIKEDSRFDALVGTEQIRSWAGLPLLVEGQVIGLIALDRHRVAAFDDEELHRAKAVTFSAAAAIRKAQLHEHVRRYAVLMERVVAVDHAVFSGETPARVAELILEGALAVSGNAAGLFVVRQKGGGRVAAATGDALAALHDHRVPDSLFGDERQLLEGADADEVLAELGRGLSGRRLNMLPVATPDDSVGSLVLVESQTPPRDTLMESFASRAAEAYLQAVRR